MKQFLSLLTLALLLCLGTFASAQIPSYVPTNGLVGWWPFNGNANDESGNGNHGTVNGALLTIDRKGANGKAYSFDGIDDHIEVSNSNGLNAPNRKQSISIWAKFNSFQTNQFLVSKYSGEGGTTTGYRLEIDAAFQPQNALVYRYADAIGNGGWGGGWGQAYLPTSSVIIDSINWFHIVAVANNGRDYLFINGINVDSNINLHNFNIGVNGENLLFGKRSNNNQSAYFSGLLDDIAIYNRALTAAEVQQLYLGNSSNTSAASTVPGKIHYQGLAVGANGKPIKNGTVGLRLSVLDSLPNGSNLYTETQSASTDAAGIFSTYLGGGTATAGTFANIPWANGNNKFLKVEMDAQGGTNYQNMGSTQLVSVPYALHAGSAKRAEEVMDGMTKYKHYIGELFEGGIIFHLYKDSLGIEHGLIASLNDVSNGSIWSNVNSLVAPTNGLPPQMSPQNGSLNTNLIVGQNGHVNSAASICKQYRGGGFSDWYLPAVWELQILYQSAYLIEKVLGPAGKFNFSDYWSSTEEFNSIAWAVSFSVGNSSGSHNKSQLFKVRAIRSF